MSKRCMINLSGETNEMKNQLLKIDGWVFSQKVRDFVRSEYKKAIDDGKLIPDKGKVDSNEISSRI